MVLCHKQQARHNKLCLLLIQAFMHFMKIVRLSDRVKGINNVYFIRLLCDTVNNISPIHWPTSVVLNSNP